MARLPQAALIALFALSISPQEVSAQSGDAASAWRALSEREMQCWREVAAVQGADLSSLPAQGIFPTDPQIISIYQTCASWANGLQQNFPCQLRDETGRMVNTTCDQYYSVPAGSGYRRLTDTEALSMIIRGQQVQLVQEENAAGLQARTSAVSSVWEALSARETQCWEAFSEASGSSVADLAARGLTPADHLLASVADTCRNWVNGLPQSISCQLREDGGRLFNTTCRQYYGVQDGSGFRQLSDDEFLTMVSNGRGAEIQMINEELPSAREARLEREQAEQELAAQRQAELARQQEEQRRRQQELAQRIREIEGSWCNYENPVLFEWECNRSSGCLPSIPQTASADVSEDIEWSMVDSALRYVATTERPNWSRLSRSCRIIQGDASIELSCRVTRQLFDNSPTVRDENFNLRRCDGDVPSPPENEHNATAEAIVFLQQLQSLGIFEDVENELFIGTSALNGCDVVTVLRANPSGAWAGRYAGGGANYFLSRIDDYEIFNHADYPADLFSQNCISNRGGQYGLSLSGSDGVYSSNGELRTSVNDGCFAMEADAQQAIETMQQLSRICE